MMNVHLLHRNADFDWPAALPWNADALVADLALETLFRAMAQNDERIFGVARQVVLAGVQGDAETIAYRQSVLQDCLKNIKVVHELYAIATEALERAKKRYLGTLARYPHWVLSDAIEHMESFADSLRRLRAIADRHAGDFTSQGWTAFISTLKRELDHEFFVRTDEHLRHLKFRGAVTFGTHLVEGNKPGRYILRRTPHPAWSVWRMLWERLRTFFFSPKLPPHSFAIHPRDEAGIRALDRLHDRGIAEVANSLARAKDHVRNFFDMLASELAFYIGCASLREQLARKGEPVCLPIVAGEQNQFAFRGLYDVCLSLSLDRRVIGNAADADGKNLVVITGANQGGKSTLLRSIGLAQMMMQCGMFVPADAFRSSLCSGLFTHYKREEDVAMESGKFDEELSRMSDIVDHIAPHSMILFNESFAATNEREGSEITRQIVTALSDKSIRIAYVTHLYELAHGLYETRRKSALFLRAQLDADGARTFKLIEGEPLRTSFGEDLYNDIFDDSGNQNATEAACERTG